MSERHFESRTVLSPAADGAVGRRHLLFSTGAIMAITCIICGEKQGLTAYLNKDLAGGAYTCAACKSEKHQDESEKIRKLMQAASKVVVTTTNHVDGYSVNRYLGIESVEVVIGTGLFSEFTSGIQDFLGERSSAFEKKLQAGKQAAFETLTMRAAAKGAHAVIGIDFGYTEFSGNRIGLIINGTLVRLARNSTAPRTEE